MKHFLLLIFTTAATFQPQQKIPDYKGKVKTVVRTFYRDPVVTYGPNYVVTDVQPDGDPFIVIAEYFNGDHQCDSVITRRFLVRSEDVYKVTYKYQQGRANSWESFNNNKKSGSGVTTWQGDKQFTVKEFDTLNKLAVVSKHFITDSLHLYKKIDHKRYNKGGKLLSEYIEEFRFDTAQNIQTSTMTQPSVYSTITSYQCMQKDVFGNPVKMVETTDDKKILCLYEYTYY